MLKARIPKTIVILMFAALPACGSPPCEQAEPFCDGEVAVTCVDDRSRRTPCDEGTYCNHGDCTLVEFSLPADAGPHLEPTEWWYYTGHLSAGEAAFGFQVTIFQYDLGADYGYMCHVAVIDEEAGEHYHSESITMTPQVWSGDELEVLDCQMHLGVAGDDHIRGIIRDGQETDGHAGEWRVDLTFTADKRAVPHGSDGIIPMGVAGGQSWYYSYTRLQAEGTLVTPESGPLAVSGQAWMDHQWGDFDIVEFSGWDWWSMQFDDGYEIMLFTFRNWEGELVSQAGTLVDPDGMLTALEGLDAFSITPLRTWASPHTDGVYPLDWDIRIESMDWDLQVRTAIDDQEMHNIAQNYWEGPTTISGTRGATKIRGVGFTELTGYASDFLDP